MKKFMAQRTYFLSFLILSVFLIAGCGDWISPDDDDNADNNPPTVISTIPADDASGVAINSAISATFSEKMDPATITSAAFTVTGPGATPVAGVVSYSGTTAVFTPDDGLDYNILYTATITTGAEDRAGNALASNYVWSFTAGAAEDTTRPVVIGTINANGDTGVAINTKFGPTFSEAMNPSTITAATFTVTGPGGAPVAGVVSYTGITAVFTPEDDLDYNTTYTLTITDGAEDLAGNAMASDYVWSFTTGAEPDTTRPIVIDTINANGATGVAINTKFGPTFSEAMNPLTINAATFTVTGPGGTPVEGVVSYTGITAVFTPEDDLDYNTTYTLTITDGAEDLAGNAMASDYVWSFTTGAEPDTTRPRVTDTLNDNGAIDVPINTNLGVTFSEAMNPLTINILTFTLTGPGTTPVAGAVSCLGSTAVFNPDDDLDYSTTYTATITTGATDLAGNQLAGNQAPWPAASKYVWSFTTGIIPDTIRPRVTGTINHDGATNVPINTNLGATFSEAMNPLTLTILTFTVTKPPGATPVAGHVSYLGLNTIFDPDSDLDYSTIYTATITTGATDLAGNQLAGNQAPLPAASKYVWSFTTGASPDVTPPLVTVTFPADAAIDVPINSAVTATFNEAMNPLSINVMTFTLAEGDLPDGAILVTGTVEYDLITHVATLTPDTDLAPDTDYTAYLTWRRPRATDLAGNELVVPAVGPPPNPWTFTTAGAGGLAPGAVPLGSASTFGLLATGSIASTGATVINGNVALHPGTSCGLLPVQVNGIIYINDVPVAGVAAQTQIDLTAAYTFAWTQASDATIPDGQDLGAWSPPGSTLPAGSFPPGVYTSASTMLIHTPLTLDAGGNVNAVWIFQVGSSLTTFVGGTPATGGNVLLANGAQAKNVFFVPVMDATVGVNTTFNGSILAGRDVTGQTGATINGRLLAGESGAGVLDLDGNTVNVPLP